MRHRIEIFVGSAGEHLLRKSMMSLYLLILLVTVLLVSPRGDYPLNDDWVYGKEVQGLLTEGRYSGHPFAAANAVAQVMWGAAFCAVFGFSFTALRVSTLVLALTAAWATAQCVRETGLSRRCALLGGAVVLVNPIFLNLSYTFMTDVPFMAMSALSGLFYLRALKEGRVRDVLIGTLFAIAAFWVRQFGVLLSVAFAMTVAVDWLIRGKKLRAGHMAAYLMPWVACGGVVLYQARTGSSAHQWTVIMEGVPIGTRGLLLVRHVFVALVYFGLFLLPLTLARILARGRPGERWTRPRWAVFLLAAISIELWVSLLSTSRLPLLQNMLRDLGTGPLTLQDTYFMNPGSSPLSIGAWWWPVTVLAIVSASLLFVDIFYRHIQDAFRRTSQSGESAAQPSQTLFLLLWAVLLTAAPYNPYLRVVLDRYLLPSLIPICILALRQLPMDRSRAVQWIATISCVLVYTFSLSCLQDYMAWNRARWQAIDELITVRNIDPFRIDGGFEYNGMYTSDEFMVRNDTTDLIDRGPLGWWTLDNTYAVSFLPRDGYEELDRVSYFSFLGMTERDILILHRVRETSEAGQRGTPQEPD